MVGSLLLPYMLPGWAEQPAGGLLYSLTRLFPVELRGIEPLTSSMPWKAEDLLTRHMTRISRYDVSSNV